MSDILKRYLRVVAIGAVISMASCFAIVSTAEAESREFDYGVGFPANETLERRVEFWRLIFTKYGEHQVVFHHRDYPEIIYSVIDFSEYARNYSGSALARIKLQELEAEEQRIRAALSKLADELTPTSPFERRVVSLFKHYGDTSSGLSRRFKAAAEEKQIRSQTGIKERFREGVKRASRYMYAIEAIFAHDGLPVELGRLPLIESSFDYNAYSSVGAAGIWQFMRRTGQRYMIVSAAVDERRDPITSTRGAAQYLAHAFEVLQSWPLAITSYNHGINGILRAVKQVGTKDLATIVKSYDGSSFGFASSNFYVEFLAAVDIERNWQKYFPDLNRDEPRYFDEVLLDRPVAYANLLRGSGLSQDEFLDLNRGILKPVQSGRAKVPTGYTVKVSRGQGTRLIKHIGGGELMPLLRATKGGKNANAPGNRQGRAAAIAKVGKTSPIIVERSGRIVNDGNSLRDEAPSPEGVKPNSYIVKKGDTLSGIAKAHGVRLAELKAANPSLKKKLRIGQTINIP